ncbi:DUF2934 domain-containing protein [Rhizobium mongolense]|uniref:DUF2934 domain-containing protein n=1 Tax=Rhizobium mongolense TaxID=57676 RepID=UPI0016108D83
MQKSKEEQLQARAYSIGEREGCPEGKDRENWELGYGQSPGQSPSASGKRRMADAARKRGQLTALSRSREASRQ